MQYSVSFPTADVRYIFDIPFTDICGQINLEETIIITDEHVASLYEQQFAGFKRVIAIPPGEGHKNLARLGFIAEALLEAEAHRRTFILAVGGGVVTDVAGFVASTYMRGLSFAFVPTTLLGMVDAAIGGKNGVNYGLQKNLLGTIQQPEFIFYNISFLNTLPQWEWSNGFAEIIKYACLFDTALLEELEQHDLQHYINNSAALMALIQKCAGWKNKIVQEDEKETGSRKLLNFGHTAGHAIETVYELSHGQAVGLGMIIACMLSVEHSGLDSSFIQRLLQLLQRYALPFEKVVDPVQLIDVLKMDKKRNVETIDFILLSDIGQPLIQPLTLTTIHQALETFSHASHH
jgi:3-dehydroquinate synthase